MKIKALMKDCQVQFVNDNIKGYEIRSSNKEIIIVFHLK